MNVPWPSQDWIEVTMPSKSWDFFDPATNIHWHLLWDKVIWMVPPQHVHPQHTNLGCPEGFFVDSKLFTPEVLTANQPWWQLEMLWERDAFCLFRWLFLQNCCSMFCILPSFHKLCVVFFPGNFDVWRAWRFRPTGVAVHSSNRKVQWFTKLKAGHTEKMCKNFTLWNSCHPSSRDTKKGTPCNHLLGHHFVFDQKNFGFLGPKVSAKATFTPEGLVDKANTTRHLQSRGHLRIRRQKGCVGL